MFRINVLKIVGFRDSPEDETEMLLLGEKKIVFYILYSTTIKNK